MANNVADVEAALKQLYLAKEEYVTNILHLTSEAAQSEMILWLNQRIDNAIEHLEGEAS